MTLSDVILQWWPVIAFALTFMGGVVAWGFRLESLARMNKQANEHTNDRIDQINNNLDKRLTVIDTTLKSMHGTLERIIWRLPPSEKHRDD